jgi:hypothetical protein
MVRMAAERQRTITKFKQPLLAILAPLSLLVLSGLAGATPALRRRAIPVISVAMRRS